MDIYKKNVLKEMSGKVIHASQRLLRKEKFDRGEQTNIRDVKNCKVKGYMVNCWGRDIDLDNAWLVSEEVQTDGIDAE